MNGFILLIPFLLVRFGLIRVIDRQAVVRAAYFPPRIGAERAAYMIYQLANAVVMIGLLFFSVRMERSWLCGTGAACYLLGLLLCIASVIDFAAPSDSGFHENGVYRFSRNPMYVSYDLLFAGCALLVQSWLLGCFVFLFVISSHWIILSEERWCIQAFGAPYRAYMKRVRRYF
ncbi:MAG: isoprenylcysteine carboxylmethyltransferase family protein [Clostridiaceae bacterium]|nr:isoprenylcysteine carboxylmethyltransferase family protein [Clostridiaceae bacterium]